MDDDFEAGMITEPLPRGEFVDAWDDGIEPEVELPLGELPSVIVDWS